MAQNRHWEQDKDATVYVGNIDERATPAMVYEIMLQMGPIHNLHMPRDRVTQNHQGFGFVEFRTPADADYAANVMNGIKLYGKSVRVNKASADKSRAVEVGAELYIGNLDMMVDEKLLYDTFSRFGPLINLPKIARDESGTSKGYGFVSYSDFDSSDAAIETMNSQYILSKQAVVQYAFKKDGKNERHGDEAERQLAAQAKKHNIVPESQLPAALRERGPGTGANATPAAAIPRGVPPGFDPKAIPGMVAPGMPPAVAMGLGIPPHGTMSPQYAPPANQRGYNSRGAHNQNAAHSHVHQPMGLGMPVLPPAPTGLPARPPAGQPSFTNPADFHPGYRGAPPGTAPAGAPTGTASPVPAAGAVGVAPPGVAVTAPPGMPAPPGFGPPPGIAGAQSFPHHPPPGFSRR
ncbi:Splicing factor 3B subunit 4 [Ceratocystis fimbriata CBS 114723]|uniref:Splicing factor 3B subunit 4 n=1 Tax=Ceratocystis fimbriata CBS 114723 TaxID=1035309 RepID=A0A2C5X872_9PEZI|nr:Splicing factor 3B subunit 4 [Ceratocystis fimbriata CBS 114723]